MSIFFQYVSVPLSFGSLNCRKAGDIIAMPSLLASMNSVGELVETNISDTNELAEAVKSWRGASGEASN